MFQRTPTDTLINFVSDLYDHYSTTEPMTPHVRDMIADAEREIDLRLITHMLHTNPWDAR